MRLHVVHGPVKLQCRRLRTERQRCIGLCVGWKTRCAVPGHRLRLRFDICCNSHASNLSWTAVSKQIWQRMHAPVDGEEDRGDWVGSIAAAASHLTAICAMLQHVIGLQTSCRRKHGKRVGTVAAWQACWPKLVADSSKWSAHTGYRSIKLRIVSVRAGWTLIPCLSTTSSGWHSMGTARGGCKLGHLTPPRTSTALCGFLTYSKDTQQRASEPQITSISFETQPAPAAMASKPGDVRCLVGKGSIAEAG